jgi:hypothetical protein
MLGCLPLYLIARESGQVGEGNQVKLDNILRGGLFGHGSKKTWTYKIIGIHIYARAMD